ncbi:GspH/FimT family pseudopilin [Alcanivorax sp. S6407]|uniref:GspH/FimT family pseudopilin n=1 Tax=Alcanivorax sp. S6407 TaxID=2926424 RepID=UPI001FF58151|nr:GspH/FimT family pseudopilin [Alcanivorax sp. S6407]MCK0155216.1 GspH/FimT family pseudopilin [Alcanivorax sp. S6407]
MKLQAGTTLLEALIALVIMGTLLSISLPPMQRMVTSQRLAAAANDTLAVLLQARSSSLVRGDIVICIKNSGCEGDAPGPGLQAFHDSNKNLKRDSGETIVAETGNAKQIQWQWKSFRGKPWFRYQASGKGYYQNGSFYVCLKGHGRRVVMNWAGRPRIEKDVPEGSCPANNSGG